MVRIRVKILEHDGSLKKPKLIRCICDADALVYLIIENKEAFILVTNNQGMDSLFMEESRHKFREQGLQIQFLPEFEASGIVILKKC